MNESLKHNKHNKITEECIHYGHIYLKFKNKVK